MLNMSTFFKVQMGQNRVITGISAVDPTVRVVKRLISVKTIGFYIVSPVGKVIFKYNENNSGAKKLWNIVAAPFKPEAHHLNKEETVLSFNVMEVE
jgi:hypothetical protein